VSLTKQLLGVRPKDFMNLTKTLYNTNLPNIKSYGIYKKVMVRLLSTSMQAKWLNLQNSLALRYKNWQAISCFGNLIFGDNI
jgi:hypothetical protein